MPSCYDFADVGCDHGIIAYNMLKLGKCQKVVISDVSSKSLKKAEKLLEQYLNSGKAVSVVADGLNGLPQTECVLIAGLGGEEIIKILSAAPFFPQKLVLQPMKNSEKLRMFLIDKGYSIKKDYVFREGYMFYDLIVCERGKDVLTEEEIKFGRTNVRERGRAFTEKIYWEMNNIAERIKCGNLSGKTLKEFNERLKELKKYV